MHVFLKHVWHIITPVQHVSAPANFSNKKKSWHAMSLNTIEGMPAVLEPHPYCTSCTAFMCPCCQGGEITVPGKGSMFYLSQRPYLVAGSLRDQLLYPWPPQGVMDQSHGRAHRHPHKGTPRSARHHRLSGSRDFSHMAPAVLDADELDRQLEAALEAVELDYLLGRYTLSIQASAYQAMA